MKLFNKSKRTFTIAGQDYKPESVITFAEKSDAEYHLKMYPNDLISLDAPAAVTISKIAVAEVESEIKEKIDLDPLSELQGIETEVTTTTKKRGRPSNK